jgi:hypothetical protein
MPYSL